MVHWTAEVTVQQAISDLLPLSEAVRLLRRAHRPRGLQSLRDRIIRGTLRGVRRGRYWYVYRDDVERLARQPLHSQGGRPHSVTESSAAYAQGRLAVNVDEVLRLGELPLEMRCSAMLGAQGILFGIKRARLERRFPRLSSRDIVIKMFEELQDGERFSRADVLRGGRPRAG